MRSFQITGIDHVVVRTADQALALAFYRDVLGLTVERQQPEIGLIQLRAGRSLIDLIPADPAGVSDPQRPNIDHFALGVSPFVEAALRAHLSTMQIPILEAGPRYGATGEGPSLYIRDPDGNKVELKDASGEGERRAPGPGAPDAGPA